VACHGDRPCLGGGQLGLGIAATALGVFALWDLKSVERRLRQERSATLAVEIGAGGPSEQEIRRRLDEAGLAVTSTNISLTGAGTRSVSFTLRYPSAAADPHVPSVVGALARENAVAKVDWRASP
jgi:putative Mg2+ transporter-C (MgtC) family protein